MFFSGPPIPDRRPRSRPDLRPASILQTLVTMSELAADDKIVRIPKSVSNLASLDAEEPLNTGRTSDPGGAAIELLGRFW
jgi:hypothetical protein